MSRFFTILAVLAWAACISSGQNQPIPQDNNYVTQAPIGTEQRPYSQPQPGVTNAYNGGNTVQLRGQEGFVSRPDGRSVYFGKDGQIYARRPNRYDSNNDESVDGLSSGGGSTIIKGRNGDGGNVFINGGKIFASRPSRYNSNSDEIDGLGIGGGSTIINGRNGNRGNVIINGGRGGVFINGDHSVSVVNGAVHITEGGQEYVFAPRAPGVNEQESVNINGKPATVYYEQGGVRVEFANGSVIAYGINGEGLFMGERESWINRKQISENIQRETEEFQKKLHEDLLKMQEELRESLGKINLFS